MQMQCLLRERSSPPIMLLKTGVGVEQGLMHTELSIPLQTPAEQCFTSGDSTTQLSASCGCSMNHCSCKSRGFCVAKTGSRA